MFTFLSTGDNCGNVYMYCEIISIELDDEFVHITDQDKESYQLRVLIKYGGMYNITVTKKYLKKDIAANHINALVNVIKKINNYTQISKATMLEEIEKVILRKNVSIN